MTTSLSIDWPPKLRQVWNSALTNVKLLYIIDITNPRKFKISNEFLYDLAFRLFRSG